MKTVNLFLVETSLNDRCCTFKNFKPKRNSSWSSEYDYHCDRHDIYSDTFQQALKWLRSPSFKMFYETFLVFSLTSNSSFIRLVSRVPTHLFPLSCDSRSLRVSTHLQFNLLKPMVSWWRWNPFSLLRVNVCWFCCFYSIEAGCK